MWVVLLFGIVSLRRGVYGSLAEELAETTQLCCNQGTNYARSHSSEDCSSSIPPDVPSNYGTLCIFAMDQCCKEYFQKKKDCDVGVDIATSTSSCSSTKDSIKSCCNECTKGSAVGRERGASVCTSNNRSTVAEDLLAGDAFFQCCKKAAEEKEKKESHVQPRQSNANPVSLSTSSSAASLCEEYAPNELCAHHCIPVPGSYKCECNPGFMLMSDGRNCKEVVKNRCKPRNPCQHKCNDNGVVVKCTCRRGYQLMNDGKSCEDIDECLELDRPVCLPNTQCYNIQGSYKCIPKKNNVDKGQCPAGFVRNVHNNVCDDVNECQLPNPPCPAYTCDNTVGGYKCGGIPGDPANLANSNSRPAPVVDDRCPPGFRAGGYNDECEDVDECLLHKDDCNPLSQFCINTRGSFYCQNKVSKHCPPGFKIDPRTNKCEDINECEDGQDICRADQVCVNVPGEYDCKPREDRRRASNCPDGMRMNPKSNYCEDIDECAEGTHLCDVHQSCLNTNGSHECHCRRGFQLDRITGGCVDVNECATDTHNCIPGSQRCDNTVGSFLCIRFTSCGTGYILQAATGQCEDIDECALGKHNCNFAGPEYQCENHPGSFRCVRKHHSTTSTATPEYEWEYYDSEEETDANQTSPSANVPEQPSTLVTTTTPKPIEVSTPSTQPTIPAVDRIPEIDSKDSEPSEPVERTPDDERSNEPQSRSEQPPPEPDHREQIPPEQPREPERRPESQEPSQPDPTNPYERPDQGHPDQTPPDLKRDEVLPQPSYPSDKRDQPEPTYYPDDRRNQVQPEQRYPDDTRDQVQPESNYPDDKRDQVQPEPTYPEERRDSVQPEPTYPEERRDPVQPEPRYPDERRDPAQPQQPVEPTNEQVPDQTPEPERPEPTNPVQTPNLFQPNQIPEIPQQPDLWSPWPERRNQSEEHPDHSTNESIQPETTYRPESPHSSPSIVYVDIGKETATVRGEKTEDGGVVVDTGMVPKNEWTKINERPTNCQPGFEANDYGDCVDRDECSTNRHSCSGLTEVCRNTRGGYLCECATGFRRDRVTGACDVIIVSTTPAPATTPVQNATTKQLFWGYPDYRPVPTRPFRPRTLCDVGYHYNAKEAVCEDINECMNGQANCAAVEICVNTEGGYRCECPPNWRLDEVRHRCVSMRSNGRFPAGYGNEPAYPLPSPSDVQHSFQGSKYVEPAVTNLGDSRSIFSCPNGYKLGYDNTCEDIDECATGQATCGGMMCTNLPGGYVCSCPQGHKLVDGNRCEDVDECELGGNLPICSQNADCVNTVGSYQCKCHTGFRSAPVNDKVCVDVDECTESPSGSLCQHRCNNVWGGYRCSCHRGYRLNPDNRTCADVDECTESKTKIICVGRCMNEPGSYRCTCPSGYRLSEDKRSCIDIDECETGVAPCAGMGGAGGQGSSDVCLNTRGGYRCHRVACPPGYKLEHRHRCTRIEKICPPRDWECAHQPTTYSYNFITFVSKLYIPDSKVDLFTMRGPAWPNANMKFELHLANVNAPPTVKDRADIHSFTLSSTSNQAVVSLVRSLEGPQSIELELSMKLYSGGTFGGIAVAKLYIYVSEYEF